MLITEEELESEDSESEQPSGWQSSSDAAECFEVQKKLNHVLNSSGRRTQQIKVQQKPDFTAKDELPHASQGLG